MNKTKSLLVILLLTGMLLGGCGGQAANQGTITVSGAFALYPMMTRWAEEYQKANPDIQFDISAGGAGKGMTDTLSGAVDIGMVSRDISTDEEAQGAYWVAVTKDAVFPVVNADNPVLPALMTTGITQETFTRIFIAGDLTTWGNLVGDESLTDEIHVYTRSDACGAAETWAKYLGGGKQEDLLGIAVFGDPGLLETVLQDPLGIGYNNLNYAYDMTTGQPVEGAVILPIDINENGVADPEEVLATKEEAIASVANGIFPSPPARPLNLVTNGEPDGIVKDFIAWVLTDGQAFVGEAGYIQLTNEQLDASLQKVK